MRARQVLGDFMWVLRCAATGLEFVLDVIVERKQIADLLSSIRDGRYKEQRKRLKECGVRHVAYLLEGDEAAAFRLGAPERSFPRGGHGHGTGGGAPAALEKGLRTAEATLQSVFGFLLHRSPSLAESMQFLATLDAQVRARWGGAGQARAASNTAAPPFVLEKLRALCAECLEEAERERAAEARAPAQPPPLVRCVYAVCLGSSAERR